MLGRSLEIGGMRSRVLPRMPSYLPAVPGSASALSPFRHCAARDPIAALRLAEPATRGSRQRTSTRPAASASALQPAHRGRNGPEQEAAREAAEAGAVRRWSGAAGDAQSRQQRLPRTARLLAELAGLRHGHSSSGWERDEVSRRRLSPLRATSRSVSDAHAEVMRDQNHERGAGERQPRRSVLDPTVAKWASMS
jgi:hypothetical protein